MQLATKPFHGQHCETTATGTLFNHIGIELSEPMLFGLGEGLSFIYWNMKSFDFPFLGGRVKPDVLTYNIANHLGVELCVKETSSQNKAWKMVKELLDDGKLVGLKLDAFHLEYFSKPFHFAGHYAAMTGYDEQNAFLVDTAQQGTEVKTSLESLAKARNEKGPMSSKNLYYTIASGKKKPDIKKAVVAATKANAATYLSPPISNSCYRGIEKTAKEVVKWFDRTDNIESDFRTSAMLMERAGTGGSLFRNLYRDFLKEAHSITGKHAFAQGHKDFCQIAADWAQIVQLFEQIAETKERDYVLQAADLFRKLSVAEKQAMEGLADIK